MQERPRAFFCFEKRSFESNDLLQNPNLDQNVQALCIVTILIKQSINQIINQSIQCTTANITIFFSFQVLHSLWFFFSLPRFLIIICRIYRYSSVDLTRNDSTKPVEESINHLISSPLIRQCNLHIQKINTTLFSLGAIIPEAIPQKLVCAR